MKRTVFALLAASTGCNWAFGINETRAIDAGGPGIDAPYVPTAYSSLTWAVVQTDGMGNPDGEVVHASIGSETLRPEVPTIMVGPRVGSGELVGVPYNTSEVTLDNGDKMLGAFGIPLDQITTFNRVVYTLPGDPVVYEVQGAKPGALYSIPRTARLNTPAAPTASSIQITPVGLPGSSITSRVQTTGAWTEVIENGDGPPELEFSGQNGRTMTINNWTAKAVPMTGPLVAPDPAVHDKVIYSQWTANNAQMGVTGYSMVELALTANTLTVATPDPAWVTTPLVTRTTIAKTWPLFTHSNTRTRMKNVLQSLIYSTDSGNMYPFRWPQDYVEYGIIPSAAVTPLVMQPDGRIRSFVLPFYHSEDWYTSTPQFIDLTDVLPFPKAVRSRLWSYRDTNGVRLVSAVDIVVTNVGIQYDWEASLAVEIKLGATDLGTTGTDSTMLPQPTAVTQLTWDDDPNHTADDYLVVLHEIANNTLTPKRRYHVVARSVDVDPALLEKGKTYVFSIMSRDGLPNADAGDFRTVTMPFSTGTVFGRTFTISP